MSAQRSPNKEHVSRSQGLDDADYHIKEAFEILQREATRLRQEQESIDAMSKKLEHVHFSSTVNLNVGGHCFKTSVQTLTKDSNTMLAAMFSGKFETKPCEGWGGYKTCRDAFLFSMVNPPGLEPTKMPLMTHQQEYAMWCNSSCGPLFGGEFDLSISNNANTSTSYSRLGKTYELPPGEQSTFFTGSNSFTVTDYEVFGFHA